MRCGDFDSFVYHLELCFFLFACECTVACDFGLYIMKKAFFCDCWAGLSHNTFMDVVKATLKRASTAHDSVAVRAENNSYSFAEIVSSAWSICNHLRNGNFKSVSMSVYHVIEQSISAMLR